jgi:hypothetical protein
MIEKLPDHKPLTVEQATQAILECATCLITAKREFYKSQQMDFNYPGLTEAIQDQKRKGKIRLRINYSKDKLIHYYLVSSATKQPL